MRLSQNLSNASCHWGLAVLAGAIGFAAGIVGFVLFGPDWVGQALTDAPAAVAGVVMGAILALAAMAIAAMFVIIRVRAHYRLVRSALNSMTQGLCTFDSSARLLLCNERYIEMYHLRHEHAQRGTPLRDLLVHRASAGTFSGDPDRYVAECLKRLAEGRTETKTIEIKDGRVIALVSRPMAGGGWLATHTDVTEQLLAEKERDALRQREERRRVIDAAISSFRARVESVLETVGQSATAMKAAAKTLLGDVRPYAAACRGRGARLQRGLGQRRNCGNRRGGAFEFDQGDQPSAHAGERGRAQRRRRRQHDERRHSGTRAGGAEDRRRGQAHPGHRRSDQSVGAQRHHRGGARRRGRARLCRGRLGGQIARRADREGHRGDHARDCIGAELHRQCRDGDPRHHAADAGHQPIHHGGRRLRRAAGSGHRRNFAQRRQRRRRRQGRRRGARRSRRRRDADAQLGGNDAGRLRTGRRGDRESCAAKSKIFWAPSRRSALRDAAWPQSPPPSSTPPLRRSAFTAAAASIPSKTYRRHARPAGLRGSPIPPATGRGACRRRQRFFRSRSGSRRSKRARCRVDRARG